MQIHVEVRSSSDVRLSVFSKSKRDSTADRLNAHWLVDVVDWAHISIILAALGLPVPDYLPVHPDLEARATAAKGRTPKSIILEAEVVPYNEGQRDGNRGPGVEEFWWLGAAGVTADGPELK